WLCNKREGTFTSIDADREACNRAVAALSDRADVYFGDSITLFRHEDLYQALAYCDLLYLDSMDYSAGSEINSIMHQVGELGAAWPLLPSGCLIASDDCFWE